MTGFVLFIAELRNSTKSLLTMSAEIWVDVSLKNLHRAKLQKLSKLIRQSSGTLVKLAEICLASYQTRN